MNSDRWKYKSGIKGKRLLHCSILFIALGAGYLTIDYFGPSGIRLKTDTVFGFSCLRARDLIVQEYDSSGNLWATRGMIIYKLGRGEDEFRREAHVPTGLSVFWIRNFTVVRRLTLRPECVEMTVTDRGDICALSAGSWWIRYSGSGKFIKTMQLANYGFGDQGVRNDGILCTGDSTLYFGEYFQNPGKGEVNVYRTTDNLTSWKSVYSFPPGKIRHVHAVQKDPYTGKIWICTGDLDRESSVGWSDDEFETLHIIGKGSQLWRVCQLVFTEEALYWGTDTGILSVAGIYKWDRKSGNIQKLYELDGPVFYGITLANGTIVMSSNREGMKNEKDDRTRLFIIANDKTEVMKCGTWHHKKPGFRFKYAKLRFQRNSGAESLAISIMNQKELPDGDLIIIDEDELVSRVTD